MKCDQNKRIQITQAKDKYNWKYISPRYITRLWDLCFTFCRIYLTCKTNQGHCPVLSLTWIFLPNNKLYQWIEGHYIVFCQNSKSESRYMRKLTLIRRQISTPDQNFVTWNTSKSSTSGHIMTKHVESIIDIQYLPEMKQNI